jgi:hypothetical protein
MTDPTTTPHPFRALGTDTQYPTRDDAHDGLMRRLMDLLNDHIKWDLFYREEADDRPRYWRAVVDARLEPLAPDEAAQVQRLDEAKLIPKDLGPAYAELLHQFYLTWKDLDELDVPDMPDAADGADARDLSRLIDARERFITIKQALAQVDRALEAHREAEASAADA